MKLQHRVRMRQIDCRATVAEREIRDRVRTILASHYGRICPMDRRRERRYPFPHLVRVTPLAGDGRTPEGSAIVAVGRELSEGGFGFFHAAPLPHRQMIVTLDSADGQWFGFVIDLTWCRFLRQGWYESGGRFLRTIPIGPPALGRSAALPEYQI